MSEVLAGSLPTAKSFVTQILADAKRLIIIINDDYAKSPARPENVPGLNWFCGNGAAARRQTAIIFNLVQKVEFLWGNGWLSPESRCVAILFIAVRLHALASLRYSTFWNLPVPPNWEIFRRECLPRMNPDIRVMALTKRWSHHTDSGGYDRLAQAVGAEVVRRPAPSRWLWHHLARKWWRKHTQTSRYLLDYQYEDLLAERNLLRQAGSHRPDVIHVLYGDEELDLLLRQRSRLPCPLVATFHLPGQHVRNRFEFFHKGLLNGINAAVVVSRCQLPDFQRWLGPERVVYVPHGIDTQRFTPGVNLPQRQEVRLLTVGHHMRDFEALRRIMDECDVHRLPAHFDLVLPRQHLPSFTGCRNARLQTGIGETELVRQYQEADALLLPVIDATANNSLLESLASGTPVITNAVGGMSDYVNHHCGWLFEPGRVAGMVELIATMCRHREIAASRREAARRQALEFDWTCVARQMRAVYMAVLAGGALVNAVKTWDQIPNGNDAGMTERQISESAPDPAPLPAANGRDLTPPP